MVKSKQTQRSNKYHSSRVRNNASHLSLAKVRDHKVATIAKNVILAIIALTTLTVVAIILITQFSTPEHIVTHEIESIATDYYENYFYPEITTNNPSSPEQIFAKYETTGFARVSLRQLLLFDNERHASSATLLSSHCDTNTTFVQFFPTAPFSKSDYRTEYHYSCNF